MLVVPSHGCVGVVRMTTARVGSSRGEDFDAPVYAFHPRLEELHIRC